jgi:Putative Actinobacterial Holin-X, holin superfamily III
VLQDNKPAQASVDANRDQRHQGRFLQGSRRPTAEIRLTRERMPRENHGREGVTASLYRLSQDGRSWIAAEAALAKAEVFSDGKRLAWIVVLLALVCGCMFASVILLSAFVVTLLAPYVNGLANAAGIMGLLLAALAVALVWRIRTLASTQLGLTVVAKRWWNIFAKSPEPAR